MNDTERKEQEPTKYVRVKEVMDLCSVSESRAYRIMRELNDELKKQGFVTTAGRVSRKYLMERLGI
nr:transcriptional regulator [uncultured Dysosmobacter sp.]